jgi:hypothetical protein
VAQALENFRFNFGRYFENNVLTAVGYCNNGIKRRGKIKGRFFMVPVNIYFN